MHSTSGRDACPELEESLSKKADNGRCTMGNECLLATSVAPQGQRRLSRQFCFWTTLVHYLRALFKAASVSAVLGLDK